MCKIGQSPLNQAFALGIECRRGFVQDQYRSIDKHGPGDGDTLPLSAGKHRSAFADLCVVAIRQLLDKVVSEGNAGGIFDLFRRRIRFAVGDVVGDGIVEQDRFLRHKRDLSFKADDPGVAEVDAVPGDRPFGRVIKPLDEFDKARFAAAALADEGDHRALGDLEIDVLKDLFIAVAVLERNIIEPDRVRKHRQFGGIRLFGNTILFVEDVPDIACRRKCLRDLVMLA